MKLLKMPLAAILLVSFGVGFLKFSAQGREVSDIIRQSMSYPAPAAANINRTLSEGRETGSSESSDEREEDTDRVMFLLLSAAVFSGRGQLAGLVSLVLTAGLCFLVVIAEEKKQRSTAVSQLKYYSRWQLKFLTPVLKMILNRAEEYDINPIKKIFRRIDPRNAFSGKSVGFFMEYIRYYQ